MFRTEGPFILSFLSSAKHWENVYLMTDRKNPKYPKKIFWKVMNMFRFLERFFFKGQKFILKVKIQRIFNFFRLFPSVF